MHNGFWKLDPERLDISISRPLEEGKKLAGSGQGGYHGGIYILHDRKYVIFQLRQKM